VSFHIYQWPFIVLRCHKCQAHSPEVKKDNNIPSHQPSPHELELVVNQAESAGWYVQKHDGTTVLYSLCADCVTAVTGHARSNEPAK